MADPLWLDSDVIMAVANGDVALEREIRNIASSGTELLMVPKVQQECLVGNPLNERAVRRGTDIKPANTVQPNADAIRRLNVRLDTSSSRYTMEDRLGLAERGTTGADGRPLPAADRVQPSDSQVLSEVTASASSRGVRLPRLLTLDRGVLRNALRWGVTPLARASVPTPGPQGGGGGGGGGGGSTTATTGEAWSGPGGTPGYNPSRMQNAGAALQLFQNWASQLSAMNTYYAALGEIRDREDEIIALQKANPFDAVVIKVTFKINNENLPAEMPRMYELIAVEIGNESLAHGDILGQNQHGYMIRIAALKRRVDADNIRPDPKPGVNQSWQQRYDTFIGSLYSPGGNVQDPTASLSKLDSLKLVDVLPILKKLKKNERFAFDRLQQALDWPTSASAFNRPCLCAAFMAVRAEENATGAFQNYVSSCKDYGTLSADQKKTIEAFISGTLVVNAGILRPQGLQGSWSAETGDVKFVVNFGVPGDDVQGRPAKTGNVYWCENTGATRHWGEWAIAGTTLTFSFWDDPPAWKRIWTATLGVVDSAFQGSTIQGTTAIGGKTIGGFKFTKTGVVPLAGVTGNVHFNVQAGGQAKL